MSESDKYYSSVELVFTIGFCLDDQYTKFELTQIRYHDIYFLLEVSPEKYDSEQNSRFQVSVFEELKIIPRFEVYLRKLST